VVNVVLKVVKFWAAPKEESSVGPQPTASCIMMDCPAVPLALCVRSMVA
jgi:hypothetical protein